jgi:hypothetical protein
LMMLRGLPLVLQAACSDGLAFDPFSLCRFRRIPARDSDVKPAGIPI